MNPELRIKVAESLGWKPKIVGQMIAYEDPQGNFRPLPDYTGSLDACREFEREAPHEYWSTLLNETHAGIHSNPVLMLEMFAKSTPEQRCRAWLKMKGVGV